jgi:Tfp pilus assembly protein FimT
MVALARSGIWMDGVRALTGDSKSKKFLDLVLNVRQIVLVKRSSSDGTEITFANDGSTTAATVFPCQPMRISISSG